MLYPVHLNPNVKGPVEEMLGSKPGVHLVEPKDYPTFVYLMNPEGDYQQHFAYSDPPEVITAGIRRHF